MHLFTRTRELELLLTRAEACPASDAGAGRPRVRGVLPLCHQHLACHPRSVVGPAVRTCLLREYKYQVTYDTIYLIT